MDRKLGVALTAVLFAALLFTALPGYCEDSLSPTRAKDLWRLQFRGHEPESPEAIRRALAAYIPVQRTLDSDNTQQEFLDAVCAAVERGYRLCGYHQVQVTATDDANATIVIDKGAQGQCGDIRVSGDERVDREQLIDRLTTPCLLTINAKDPQVFWQREHSAAFSEQADQHRRDIIESALKALGYNFAKFDVRVVAEDDPGDITLEITIHDSGGRQQFSGIEFSGLTRHTADEVLDQLELPDELSANPELLDDIAKQLLNTGRFLTVHTFVETPFDADHVVPLRVDVIENTDAPQLSEPLSDRDVVLTRLARWLESWPQQDLDCHVTVELPLSDPGKPVETKPTSMSVGGFTVPMRPLSRAHLELTVSSRRGLAGDVRLYDAEDRQVLNFSAALTTEQSLLVSRGSKSFWQADASSRGVELGLNLHGQDPKLNHGRRYATSTTAGFRTPAPRPFTAKISVNPAAVFGLVVADEDNSIRTENGTCQIPMKSGEMNVDAETGRLLQLQIRENGLQFTVRTEHGLFDEHMRQLQEETTGWPNHYDATRGFQSQIGFLAAEYGQLLVASDDDSARLIHQILTTQGALDPLYQIWSGNWAEHPFVIPPEDGQPAVPGSDMSGIHFLTAFLPPDAVETRFLQAWGQVFDAGDMSALKSTLLEIREMMISETDGPLINFILGSLVPKYASACGARGVSRLSRDELPPSVRLVLDESCLLGDMIRNGVTTLRELSDDEARLLKGIVQSEEVELWMNVATKIEIPPVVPAAVIDGVRAHSSDDPNVVARDVLTHAWKLGLYDMAKSRLERMASQPSTSVFRTSSHRTEQKDGASGESDPLGPIEIPDLDQSFFSPTRKVQ